MNYFDNAHNLGQRNKNKFDGFLSDEMMTVT